MAIPALATSAVVLVLIYAEALTPGRWASVRTVSSFPPPTARPRMPGRAVPSRLSIRGRHTLEHARLRQSSHPVASSAVKNPTTEILDALFPPGGDVEHVDVETGGVASYAQRVQAGRAAQGFLTTDAVATRTLVPPRELTYGEYDLSFFFELVDECLSIRAGREACDRAALESEARKLVFGDIGSGCGRLVLAQALTWPWRSCRGVEKVSSLHEMGEAALLAAGRMVENETVSSEALHLLKTKAPCTLLLGDVNEEVGISDVDVLFCYSSSFPAYGDLLTEFSYTLGHKLRRGAQVITTDRRLVSDGPWEFALLGEREGRNSETGGKSTAYLWEVVKSAM